MKRRQFIEVTAGGAIFALTGCASSLVRAPVMNIPLLPNPVQMLAGVNAGIDGPITPEVAAHYGTYGGEFIIRTPYRDIVTAMQTMYSVDPYPNLHILWLIENADLMQAARVPFDFPQTWGIGLGNETDLPPYEWSAEHMAVAVTAGRDILRMRGWQGNILSSPIYSVDDGDHLGRYLRPVLSSIPSDVIIDLHWYGDSSDYWLDQVRSLKRRVTVSEFGMPARNTAEDSKQAVYYHSKLVDFKRCGVIEAAIAYQHLNGPSMSDLDNFGLLRADGLYKPADAVLAEYTRGMNNAG